MMTLLREGGVPMWFVLLFGLLALGSGAHYAARPDPKRLSSIAWLMGATLLAVASGTVSALGATFQHVAGDGPAWRSDTLLVGLGESMSAGTLGFSMLALTSIVVAIGQRRLAALSLE
jgi:hypothetical protein